MGRPATGKTPIQQIRIPVNEWDDLRRVTGGTHASVLRDFIRWYLRRPGAKAPSRPKSEEIAKTLGQEVGNE